MSIAIARITRSGSLSDGAPGPVPHEFLPASHRINLNNQVKLYSFLNQYRKPEALTIKGERAFDKADPIQAHNWNMLLLLCGLPTNSELAERIKLIDPDKDAETEMVRADRELELRSTIRKNRDNPEWLAKVYRRVIGKAEGIPASALAMALDSLARSYDEVEKKWGLDSFLTRTGRWVYEDEYFETRALLDLALERGVIQTSRETGEYRRKNSGEVLAHDEQKMLYVLQNDPALTAYIREQVLRPAEEPQRGTVSIESSELVHLASGLGGEIESEMINADGSTNEDAFASQADSELETLVEKLEASEFITKTGRKFLFAEISQTFNSRQAIVDFFRENPEQYRTYSELMD